MPILLVLILTAACLPLDWPNPLELDGRESARYSAVAVAVPLLAAFVLRTWAVRALTLDPSRRASVGTIFERVRRGLFYFNLIAVAVAVIGLGWGANVWANFNLTWHEEDVLAPFAELLVPLPYFLIVFGCWLLYYDVEVALLRAAHWVETPPPFWTRAGFFFHNLRQLALLILLPVGLMVSHNTFKRFYPEAAQADWFRLFSLSSVPLFVLFAPLIIKPLLGLKSLPPGRTRERIEALARRLHFRSTDLLLWPTHGSAMNAMIVGLVPRVRYVIFTDAILDEMPPDELDAVFGHEVGHARHGHIWYYALFLMLSIAVLASLFLLAGEFQEIWMLVAAGSYLFVVFGFVSRRCERQADVFGCRAISCANPDCDGHDERTVFPERGAALCSTGIKTCARALDRVHALNSTAAHQGGSRLGQLLRGAYGWLRAWQHSPLPNRVRFLLSLVDDREREARFQNRLLTLRWGLVLLLIGVLIAMGWAVGWRKLFEVM